MTKEEANKKRLIEVSEYLDLVNSYYKPLGLTIKFEDGRLVPYDNNGKCLYVGKKNTNFNRSADCYVLPDIPKTEAVFLDCDFLTLLDLERDIWADKFKISLMPKPSGLVVHEKIDFDGPVPFISLNWQNIISSLCFEVRVAQKIGDKTYEPNCSSYKGIEVADDTVMTILYADRRAIIVLKDKVRVGKDVDCWWDSEKGKFIDIPYSGYDDLYNTLEKALDSLLYNKWTNPHGINIENGGDRTLFLRVIKNFLLGEVKRAIDYLKEKDNIKVGKGNQLIKKN